MRQEAGDNHGRRHGNKMWRLKKITVKKKKMPKGKAARKTFRALDAHYRQRLEGMPLASFSRRLAAFMIDFGIIVVFLALLSLSATLQTAKKTGALTMNIDPFHGWALLSLPLYFGLSCYWGRGRTIGKKLLKIRVVSLTHERLSLWHSIERSLGYGASMLEFGFGFLQYFTHPNCQTVHDRIAETIVVSEIEGQAAVQPAIAMAADSQ
jgi:uncharacterized RDD family membrane protein YckC